MIEQLNNPDGNKTSPQGTGNVSKFKEAAQHNGMNNLLADPPTNGIDNWRVEVLEVDYSNIHNGVELWVLLQKDFKRKLPEFEQNCTIVITESGKYHFVYQTDEQDNIQILAQSRNKYEGAEPQYLDVIKTRGIDVRSAEYRLLKGGFDKPQYKMSKEEKETLYDICQSYDKWKDHKQPIPKNKIVGQLRPYGPSEPLTHDQWDELLKKHRVKVTDEIPPPKPAWVQIVDGQEIMMGSMGNISLLTGKAKAGKSTLVTYITSILLSSPDASGLFKGCLPENKRRILYFDTEQSKYHVQLVVKRISQLVSSEELKNLEVYSLRSRAPEERRNFIRHAIYKTPNVGFVIIDGIRDAVVDPNDLTESCLMATELLRWSEELDIHILNILHQNKGDTNARGHLGTELVNKSETVLSITKNAQDKSISIVEGEYCRNIEPEPFALERVEPFGLPSLAENYELRTETKKEQFDLTDLPPAEIYSMLNIVFSHGESFKYSDLVAQVRLAFKTKFGSTIGENRAKHLVTHCKNEKWVVQKINKGPYTQGVYNDNTVTR